MEAEAVDGDPLADPAARAWAVRTKARATATLLVEPHPAQHAPEPGAYLQGVQAAYVELHELVDRLSPAQADAVREIVRHLVAPG